MNYVIAEIEGGNRLICNWAIKEINTEVDKKVDDVEGKTVRLILQLVNRTLKEQGIKDNDLTDIVFNYWSEVKSE